MKFNKIYNLLLETLLSDYTKIDTYKNIEIYFSIEHIKDRNNIRYYNTISHSKLLLYVKRFLKELLQKNILDQFLYFKIKLFTLYCSHVNVYISGQLKYFNKQWHIYISTVLPNKDTYHNPSDFYYQINY